MSVKKCHLLTLHQTAIYFLRLNNMNTVPQRQLRIHTPEIPPSLCSVLLRSSTPLRSAQDDSGRILPAEIGSFVNATIKIRFFWFYHNITKQRLSKVSSWAKGNARSRTRRATRSVGIYIAKTHFIAFFNVLYKNKTMSVKKILTLANFTANGNILSQNQ